MCKSQVFGKNLNPISQHLQRIELDFHQDSEVSEKTRIIDLFGKLPNITSFMLLLASTKISDESLFGLADVLQTSKLLNSLHLDLRNTKITNQSIKDLLPDPSKFLKLKRFVLVVRSCPGISDDAFTETLHFKEKIEESL